MKKILSLVLVVLLLMGLTACGDDTEETKGPAAFQVGFGKVDITPTEPIHMMSYSDPATHISEGALSALYAMSIVMRDDAGTTMVMSFVDMGKISNTMLNEVRPLVEEKFGISEAYMTLSCPHNHNGPDYGYAAAYDQQWKDVFKQGILDSIEQAINDLAPATIEIGRTQTENLTFVRRYYLADGGMTGDNFNYDHNSTITAHESEADEEIQMVRFVRQGEKKDIMVVNWQSHAVKHGHTNFLSADYVGALRDKVEKELGVHCMFFQGAAGNLNPISRIEGECPTGATGFQKAVEHGEAVAQYVIDACNTSGVFKQIESGKVRNNHDKFIAQKLWVETNTITVGELSFVTLPAEFFDSLGKTIKEETPYEMTVLMGYTCGSDACYLPDENGFKNGGYEANNSQFRSGEGEKFVQYYLDQLNAMYKEENS